MKDGLCGQYFLSNEAVMVALKQCVTSADADCYEHSLQALSHH